MRLFILPQLALVFGATDRATAINNDTTNWPQHNYGMEQMFHTMPYYPEAVELEYRGRLPNYISGTFYRNGPGIYEWGETTYKHFFDPSAVIQAVRIKDGRVMYNSNVIKSRNYNANKDAQKIIKPELGTYGEPDWVTANPDGTPIEDEATIIENRLKFFLLMGFPTDNTLIQTYPICGNLVSMTETMFWNIHDPYTLETLGQLDISKSKNFPPGITCVTQTAHPHFDMKTGDLHQVMGCMKLPSEDNLIPKVAYLPYVLRNASRDASNQFLNPLSMQEMVDSIEFGSPFYNKRQTDYVLRYFHMFVVTENFIIVPFTSLKFDLGLMVPGVILEAQPLTEVN